MNTTTYAAYAFLRSQLEAAYAARAKANDIAQRMALTERAQALLTTLRAFPADYRTVYNARTAA